MQEFVSIDNVAMHILNVGCLPTPNLISDKVYNSMGIATPSNVTNPDNSVWIEYVPYETFYCPLVLRIARIGIEYAQGTEVDKVLRLILLVQSYNFPLVFRFTYLLAVANA